MHGRPRTMISSQQVTVSGKDLRCHVGRWTRGEASTTWHFPLQRFFPALSVVTCSSSSTIMKFEQLKVRPKKLARKAPCAAEFASVLACWASSQDLRSQSECAEVTKLLRDCMTTAVCIARISDPCSATRTSKAGQANDQLPSCPLF